MTEEETIPGPGQAGGCEASEPAARERGATLAYASESRVEEAEVSLRESESRYRRLIEHSPDIVYVFSNKRGGIFYSPRVQSVLGYSEAYLYEHPFLWNESIHPDDLPAVAEAVREFDQGKPFEVEYRLRSAHGTWVWILDRSISRIEADGEMLIEGLATDLTARKEMEAALRAAERESEAQRRRLSEVIWGTDAGTWQWNVQTGENVLNARWAEILGRRLEDLPTTIDNWRELTHPDDRAHAEVLLQRCFRRELDTYECEMRMLHASGTWVWVLSRGRVVEWTADGQPLRISGTHLDITARKRAEAERQAMEADLREAQRLEGLGRVAGGIAHDFNNVLVAMLGNAALAKEHLQTFEISEAMTSLDEIEHAGEFARTLVQQILAYSRRQPPKLVVQPLWDVVDGALKVVRMTLPAHVELRISLGSADLVGAVDATQLGQVVLNLCTNGWQALEGGQGQITVEMLACPDGHERCARLRVADSGRGMDEATRAHIFEPFFTTKPLGKGTGLGMAVVHGIVTAHGGSVRVDSAPGQGTRIDVHLPLSAQAAASPTPAAKPAHVVFVDDDRALLLLARRVLERRGLRVTTFDNGEAAMQLLRSDEHVDLVVTDCSMPGLAGVDLAVAVMRTRPDIPVVISSGYLTDETRARARDAGIRHVVDKPADVKGLCDLVERALFPS